MDMRQVVLFFAKIPPPSSIRLMFQLALAADVPDESLQALAQKIEKGLVFKGAFGTRKFTACWCLEFFATLICNHCKSCHAVANLAILRGWRKL